MRMVRNGNITEVGVIRQQDSTPWRGPQGRSLAGRRCRGAPLSAGCAGPARPAQALAVSATAHRCSPHCAVRPSAYDQVLWSPSRRQNQRTHVVANMIRAFQRHERVCLMALCQARGCQCKGACGRLAGAKSGASVCSGARLCSAKAGAVSSAAGLPGGERRPFLFHTLLRAPCRPISRLVHICGTRHQCSTPACCMVMQDVTPAGRLAFSQGKAPRSGTRHRFFFCPCQRISCMVSNLMSFTVNHGAYLHDVRAQGVSPVRSPACCPICARS